MRGSWLVVVLAVAGCDRLLHLDTVGLPPDARRCGGPELPAGGDYDGDGEPNETDACPLVAHESMHDEDHDGTPDDCDPCPQLAVISEDFDCDGIGAACDPDEATPNQRDFYAFDRDPGFMLDAATIANDQVQLSTTASSFGQLMVMQANPSDGYYETSCTLHAFTTTNYAELNLRYITDQASDTHNDTGLDWSMQHLVLTTESLATGEIIGTGPVSRVKLQASLRGSTAHIELSGDVTGSFDGAVSRLPHEVNVAINIFDPGKLVTAECDYLERIY